MNRPRVTFPKVLFAVIAAGLLVLVTGAPAMASVVIPPGQNGNACSVYKWTTPANDLTNIYWQTCSWADNNEVYFTVNFGNPNAVGVVVNDIYLQWYASGPPQACRNPSQWPLTNFAVPAHSVKGTNTALCAFPRQRGAYQSSATVVEAGVTTSNLSPTIQVQ
jgi:hypothetical protein